MHEAILALANAFGISDECAADIFRFRSHWNGSAEHELEDTLVDLDKKGLYAEFDEKVKSIHPDGRWYSEASKMTFRVSALELVRSGMTIDQAVKLLSGLYLASAKEEEYWEKSVTQRRWAREDRKPS